MGMIPTLAITPTLSQDLINVDCRMVSKKSIKSIEESIEEGVDHPVKDDHVLRLRDHTERTGS